MPLLGPAWAILQGQRGVYKGDYIRDFVADSSKTLGWKPSGTFGLDDDQGCRRSGRYRLVVTATDVTRGQLVRLPWDYRGVYGLDPDEQPVADAVRAMSIPFLFRADLADERSGGWSPPLLDGGLLSNYPIDTLDRLDGKPRGGRPSA